MALTLNLKRGRRIRLSDSKTGEVLGWIEMRQASGGWASLSLDLNRNVVAVREELLAGVERKLAYGPPSLPAA